MSAEYFKGIEYVRISSMSEQEKELFWASFDRSKIIRIMKDQTLLNDCVLYADYAAWSQQQSRELTPEATPQRLAFRLAFR